MAIPLITHYEECICSEIRGDKDALENCSKHHYNISNYMINRTNLVGTVDILAGLLFYPGETVESAPKTFDYLARMYKSRSTDPSMEYAFHQNAYHAMYNLITTTYVGSTEVDEATDEEIGASFDTVCDDGCSLAVFESWDRSAFDINIYYMQVQLKS